MQTRNLFIVLSAILLAIGITSCTTAYKSGQMPDDVYYSPAREVTEKTTVKRYQASDDFIDYGIAMRIRDYRWRFFDDYAYRYSPYNYYFCDPINYGFYNNPYYGYYYNPFYNNWPVYVIPAISVKSATPINRKPRMVNLNAYGGLNDKNVKTNNSIKWTKPSNQYINNREVSVGRKYIPSYSDRTSNNDTRIYSPSSNSTNNSSRGSSSSGNNSGSVTRPGRGGK